MIDFVRQFHIAMIISGCVFFFRFSLFGLAQPARLTYLARGRVFGGGVRGVKERKEEKDGDSVIRIAIVMHSHYAPRSYYRTLLFQCPNFARNRDRGAGQRTAMAVVGYALSSC